VEVAQSVAQANACETANEVEVAQVASAAAQQ